MSVRISEPSLSFSFRIEVDGPVECTGYFTEISGIEADNVVVEHKVVDDQGREIVQMIPGRGDGGEIVLKSGSQEIESIVSESQ